MAEPSRLVSQPGKRSRWDLNSRFVIGQPGNPMMERWRLLQTPRLGVYVHFIYREDLDPVPHDHPWIFRSLVLRGGYDEEFWPDARVDESRPQTFRRGSFHRFPLAAAHRITSVLPRTITLVIVGRKHRTWGFWHDGRFTDYRDALGLRPQEGDPRKRPRDGAANDPPVLVDHGAEPATLATLARGGLGQHCCFAGCTVVNCRWCGESRCVHDVHICEPSQDEPSDATAAATVGNAPPRCQLLAGLVGD